MGDSINLNDLIIGDVSIADLTAHSILDLVFDGKLLWVLLREDWIDLITPLFWISNRRWESRTLSFGVGLQVLIKLKVQYLLWTLFHQKLIMRVYAFATDPTVLVITGFSFLDFLWFNVFFYFLCLFFICNVLYQLFHFLTPWFLGFGQDEILGDEQMVIELVIILDK